MMKQVERISSPEARAEPQWRRYVSDSVLAIGGVAFITSGIAVAHLYPKVPTIAFVYLLLVLALASTRGLYAAILTSLLAFLCFDFFFFPPPYTFLVIKAEDLLTLVVFLTTAIITGQLALALRRRAEQARSRERELRSLYEQAQELASDPEQAMASIDYVLALAEAGLAEMRALIFELRPESLELEGLVAALSRQVAVLRTRYKLTVNVDLGEEPPLSLEMKQALYRIAQEALHNIVKHARASVVELRLTELADEIILEVRDNGKGFDPSAPFPGHLGLRSMRERATKMGGALTIESLPGQGTCIGVRIPCAFDIRAQLQRER